MFYIRYQTLLILSAWPKYGLSLKCRARWVFINEYSYLEISISTPFLSVTNYQRTNRLNSFIVRVSRVFNAPCRSVDMDLFVHGNNQLMETLTGVFFAFCKSYLFIDYVYFAFICIVIWMCTSIYFHLFCYLWKLLISLLFTFLVCIMYKAVSFSTIIK